MKMFSDCSGECCLCGVGQGCLAGHGDDDFYPATKEQIIERLDNGQFPSYRQMMIDHLKRAFNYDYHGYIDTDDCVKIDPKEEMNKRFGNPFYHSHTLNQQFGEAITNFLDGLQQNDGLCCHDKSKEDNMKKYSITECRECKYKVTTKDGEYNPNDIVCSYWMSDGLTEDDYCSRGVDGKYEGNDTDICEKPACETCRAASKYEFDGENWDYICECYGSPMFMKIMFHNHGCTRWTKKDINN